MPKSLQEETILQSIAAGLDNAAIAQQLGISESCLQEQLDEILRKRNLCSRVELLLSFYADRTRYASTPSASPDSASRGLTAWVKRLKRLGRFSVTWLSAILSAFPAVGTGSFLESLH